MLPEERAVRPEDGNRSPKRIGAFVAVAIGVAILTAADSRIAAEEATPPRMKAVIDGDAGLLAPAEVSEVRAKGEVVIQFYRPGDGAKRVLLKGAHTTFVADEYRFFSSRIWKVTGKQTYSTVGGVERSIFVAEPVNASQPGRDGVGFLGDYPHADCNRRYSPRIVQILGKREMLVTMGVGDFAPGAVAEVVWLRGSFTMETIRDSPQTVARLVLLRGADTTKLTEDSPPPFGWYPITGTYQYKSAGGGTRTVFVADAEKAEADRLAAQKRRDEEEHAKAEAARRADAERKAIEKAEKERKAAAEKARWRTWSDKTGKFKLEAQFLGLADDEVVLKKRDGNTIRVALKKLSTDDQECVIRWEAESQKSK